ncbi:M23 family metallopeptidase [Arenimonas sp. MALMAid1274]|uniref:M23 family metallopeptidase n=1 Tax=Arenimonas sp. MALMAid1274 TaxID=3411630 RepID=UPI003BA295BB
MKSVAMFMAGLLVGAAGLWFLLGEGAVPAARVPEPLRLLPASVAAGAEDPAPVGAPAVREDPAPADVVWADGISTSEEVPTPPSDAAAVPPAPVSEIAPGTDVPDTAPAAPEPEPPVLPLPTRTPRLLLPVGGVAATQLADTFNDARSEGRRHDAIDIMAPAGTPVLAVEDGRLVKFFDSVRGGVTIYQFDVDGEYAYYYAHLQGRADGLAEGQDVKQGQVIGYVGHTGNADPAAPHLHFAVFVLGPEKNWWQGMAINPYPLLTAP